MSCVKSLIDANCLNLLRKKQSVRGRLGWAGGHSSVRTNAGLLCPAEGQAGQLQPDPLPLCP